MPPHDGRAHHPEGPLPGEPLWRRGRLRDQLLQRYGLQDGSAIASAARSGAGAGGAAPVHLP
eukprot:8365736-Pyramimonas_sp.AAC.1